MSELDELRAKALAATDGPWEAHPPHGWAEDAWADLLVYKAGSRDYNDQITPGGGEHGDDGLRPNDARYIAAVSPDVLLRLIDRLERAEASRERWRENTIAAVRALRPFQEPHNRPLSDEPGQNEQPPTPDSGEAASEETS